MQGATVGWLVIFAIGVVLVMSVKYNAAVRKLSNMPPTLIQSPVSAVVPSMLFQRQPVLIQDEIVRPDRDLPATVFRWLHVPFATNTHVVSDSEVRTTRARYTLLWARGTSVDPAADSRVGIDISRGAGVTGARVVVSPGQVLVLPPGWRYSSPSSAPLCVTSLRGL
jgi:hypothetical protein